MIGTTLSHFKITAKLGEGGMGEVYRAEDQTLKREVALKILPAVVTRDADRLARFRREAESLAALNHPNIVTIHSFEEADGVHFLTMELVEGQTLDQRIPDKGLTTQELLGIAIPLASAVAAAHEKGVIHRDLKPSNVILTTDGVVKVLDFGLAKLEQGPASPADDDAETALMTREGTVVGTMPYMSPEQIKGHQVDVRSDVFSLGVILYEMATGGRPFGGDGAPELMSAILKDSPPPVTDLRPEIPTPLGDVIERCLEKDPDLRPATAGQLSKQLERLRDATASGNVMAARSQRRGKSMGWVAAAILTLLVLGLFWMVRRPATVDLSAANVEPIRIAVLPFDNPIAAEDEGLGEGFAKEIMLRLSGLRGIGVLSWTSTLQFKSSDQSPQEIGEQLSADYVLDGTIRRMGTAGEGQRIEVEPQLVRVADGTTVWSEPLEFEPAQLLASQSRIAGSVIRELDIGVSDKERQRLGRQPTQNPIAYEAYLRGLEALPSGHAPEEDYRKALKLLEQAVALDPDFALGYYYQADLDYTRALAEFSKAAKDLPNDADLLRSIAYIWRRQGLFDQALDNLERAAALTPNTASIGVEHSYTLCVVGEYDRALDVLERSIAIDPEQEWPYMLKALVYWSRGHEGDLALARSSLEEFPDPRSFYPAWFWILQDWMESDYQAALDRIANLTSPILVLQATFAPRELLAGLTHHYMGEVERARPALEAAVEILLREIEAAPEDPRIHSSLGLAYAALGRKDEALAAGRKAVEIYPVSQDALLGADRVWDLARISAIVGEDDLALDQIAYLRSIPTIYSPAWFKLNPSFDALRDNPRFVSLVNLDSGKDH